MVKKFFLMLAGVVFLLAVATAAYDCNHTLALWSLDFSPGTSVTDSCGGNDGSAIGPPARDVAAVIDDGHDFETTNTSDRVTFSDNNTLDLDANGPLTVAAWVKMESDTSGRVYFKGDNANVYYSMGYSAAAGKKTFYCDIWDGANYDLKFGPSGSYVGSWARVVCTFNASLFVYVNNTLNETVVRTSGDVSNANNVTIGVRKNGAAWQQWLDGVVDHVRVYDKVLWGTGVGGEIYNDWTFGNISGVGGGGGGGGITLTVTSPTNTTYLEQRVWVNGSTSGAANVTYSVDGGANQTACNNCTMFGNQTLYFLPNTTHNVWVYAMNFSNASDTDSIYRQFSIATIQAQLVNVTDYGIIIPAGGAGNWDRWIRERAPCVYLEWNSTWWCYYAGYNATPQDTYIGAAFGSNLSSNLTKYPTNPIIDFAASSPWDGLQDMDIVYLENGTIFMFVEDEHSWPGGTVNITYYTASDTDPTNFTYRGLIWSTADSPWATDWVGTPTVVYNVTSDFWHLFYEGENATDIYDGYANGSTLNNLVDAGEPLPNSTGVWEDVFNEVLWFNSSTSGGPYWYGFGSIIDGDRSGGAMNSSDGWNWIRYRETQISDHVSSTFMEYAAASRYVTFGHADQNIFTVGVTAASIPGNFTDWRGFFGVLNAPTVTLNSPANGTNYPCFTSSCSFNFMYTPVDDLGFTSATLWGNFSGLWAANASNSSAVVNNSVNGILLALGIDSYLWNVRVCDNSTPALCSFAAANRTLTVSAASLVDCSVAGSSVAMNFTFWKEETVAQMNGSMDAIFWAGNDTTYTYNVSYNGSWVNVSNVTICIFPANATLFVRSFQVYNFTDYRYRGYFLYDAVINNVTQETHLYLITNASSDLLIVTVQENGIDLQDAYVTLQRYYPAEGVYRAVEIERTDVEGEALFYVHPFNAWYRFLVLYEGSYTVTPPGRISSSTMTIEVSDEAYSNFFEYEDNVTVTCTENSSARTVACVVANPTNIGTTYRFEAKELNNVGTVQCSDSQAGAASITFTCNASNASNNVRYFVSVYTGTGWMQLDSGVLTVPFTPPLGTLGLVAAFVLITGAAFLGLPNGTSGATLFALVGVVLAVVIQFMVVPVEAIIFIGVLVALTMIKARV